MAYLPNEGATTMRRIRYTLATQWHGTDFTDIMEVDDMNDDDINNMLWEMAIEHHGIEAWFEDVAEEEE